jgi:hypothetical protein
LLGIWGSNVRFPSNDEHLNHRLFFQYKFVFTSVWSLVLRYDLNQFSKSSVRNGGILYLDTIANEYHFKYEREDNWYNSGSARNSLIFEKEWNLFSDVFWQLEGAYNMVGGGYAGYLDFNIEALMRFKNTRFGLEFCFNSGASQFNGDGAMTIYLNSQVEF